MSEFDRAFEVMGTILGISLVCAVVCCFTRDRCRKLGLCLPRDRRRDRVVAHDHRSARTTRPIRPPVVMSDLGMHPRRVPVPSLRPPPQRPVLPPPRPASKTAPSISRYSVPIPVALEAVPVATPRDGGPVVFAEAVPAQPPLPAR